MLGRQLHNVTMYTTTEGIISPHTSFALQRVIITSHHGTILLRFCQQSSQDHLSIQGKKYSLNQGCIHRLIPIAHNSIVVDITPVNNLR